MSLRARNDVATGLPTLPSPSPVGTGLCPPPSLPEWGPERRTKADTFISDHPGCTSPTATGDQPLGTRPHARHRHAACGDTFSHVRGLRAGWAG